AEMAKLGLGYADLKQQNPKLVYGVLTPFGEEGPWKDLPDYDLLVMARAGLMEKTGFPEKPTRIAPPLSYYYGSWHLTAGMLAAYLQAQTTGEG
ncbi:MAG: CoA transferase, partial [Pseudoflavonifractor sp.]